MSHRTAYRALTALIALLVLATVTFVDLPAGRRWIEVLQDAGHVPAFAIVTICLHQMLRAVAPQRSAPFRGTLVAAIGAIALGAAVELAQHFLQRDASLGDVGRDACGAVGAAALLRLLDRRGPRRGLSRALAALALAGALLIALLPLIDCARAYRHRAALFPVLADFRSPLDLYFLRPVDPPFARQCVAAASAAAPCQAWALYAPYTTATWAGPVFEEMEPDWRARRALCVEVSNPHARPFTLVIALRDRDYAGGAGDRYTGRWSIAAQQRRTLCLPLSEIAVTPRGRHLDLAHVDRLAIAQADDQHQPGFRLHRVWLQ